MADERDGSSSDLRALPCTTTDSIATLSIIAFIPDGAFWLTPDAGWKDPMKITPTLSEAKATCVATFPDDDTMLRDDFQHITSTTLAL